MFPKTGGLAGYRDPAAPESPKQGSCKLAGAAGRRRNRECKYVQEHGEATVTNHSFTGKLPKQRKGEAEEAAWNWPPLPGKGQP